MLLTWSTVLTSVGGIILGLIVLFRARKNIGNISFSLMSIFLSVEVAANYFSLTNKGSADTTLFWIRAVMVLIPFVMLFLFYFSSSYLNNKYKINVKKSIVLLVLTVIIALINTTSLTYSSVLISSGGVIIPKTGIGMLINGLFILPLFVLSIRNMYINARNSDNLHDSKMVKFALFMFLVSFGTQIITSFVIVAILNYAGLIPLGNFFTLLFVILMTISIFYLRAFNINFIGAIVFAVILVVLMFAEIFTVKGFQAWGYKSIVFLAVSFISYQFVKSIRREIKFREELQTLSDQLAKANAHLKELDAMKTEFVSLASHELLTPVSAIEGYLSMILDEHLAKVDDPKAAQYLDRIYRSSRRLARLIADMLNISRIEEGRLLVEKKDVNLSDLVKQVIDEIKFKADEKKQKVIFDTPDGWQTYGDPDKIKEVLVNLIGNSIKYSKNPGEVHLIVKKVPTEEVTSAWQKIETDIKDRPLDDQEAIKSAVDPKLKEIVGKEQILILVKDQGIGIPKEELPRLFKKFHRVGDYSTAESQGTGLGLYISRALVELHHGRIWADSEGPGKGSTFTFSLPDISDKEDLINLEKQVSQTKEQLKPLAKPMNEKIGEDI